MYLQSVETRGTDRAAAASQPVSASARPDSPVPRHTAAANTAPAIGELPIDQRASSQEARPSRAPANPSASSMSVRNQLYQATQRHIALPEYSRAFDAALQEASQLTDAISKLSRLERDVYRLLVTYTGANERNAEAHEFARRAFDHLLSAISSVNTTCALEMEIRNRCLLEVRAHVETHWPTDEGMPRLLNDLESTTLLRTDPLRDIGFRTSLIDACGQVLEAFVNRGLEHPEPWLGELQRASGETARKLGIKRPSSDDLFRGDGASDKVRALGNVWDSMYPVPTLRYSVEEIERSMR